MSNFGQALENDAFGRWLHEQPIGIHGKDWHK